MYVYRVSRYYTDQTYYCKTVEMVADKAVLLLPKNVRKLICKDELIAALKDLKANKEVKLIDNVSVRCYRLW